jgi:hypothetical protein
MMRFENPQARDEFTKVFGHSLEDLTPAQVLWLIKFAKHVRGRCRSNAALKTYLSRTFPHLVFTEVPKEWQGRTYQALQIVPRVAKGKEVTAVTEEGRGEE